MRTLDELRKSAQERNKAVFNTQKASLDDLRSNASKVRDFRSKEGASNFAKRYQNEVDRYKAGPYTSLWGKSADEIKSIQSDNTNRVSALLQEANVYRDVFGEDGTNSVIESLTSLKDAYTSIFDNADVYSKYKTEDEYQAAVKQYQAQQKEEEELLNFDFSDEAYAQIDQQIADLETAWESYEYDWTDTNARKAANKRYDEIQAEIARLRALPTTAKEYQEMKKQMDYFAGFTNSDDFEEYSLKGTELHYEDFGERTMKRGTSRRQKSVSTIDTYRAASMALYEHNGNELGYYPDQYEGEVDIFRTMKDDEFSLLAYFIAKDKDNGTNLAEQYVDSMYETLSARRGKEIADGITGINIPVLEDLAVLGYGVYAGVGSAGDGITQFLSDDKIPYSPETYANSYIGDSLDGLGYYAHSAATTVGNMAPSILLSSALTYAGVPAPISQAAGSAVMGVSAAGNAYGEALRMGYDKGQARTYSTLVGASEGVLQYVIGGIGSLGGMSGKFASKIAAIDSSLLRVSAKLGVSVGSEIIEEELQLYLEPAFRSIIFGEDYDAPTIDEIIETAIVTALSTGVLEGGGTISQGLSETNAVKKTGKTIMSADGGLAALDALSYEVANASDTKTKINLANLREKASNKNTAKNVGRLYNAVESANNQANASANKADIAKSLQRKGFNAETANDIADALVAEYNGQELTKAQEKLLKSAKKSQVVKDAISNIMVNEQSTMGQRSQNIRDFNADIAAGVISNKTGLSKDVVKALQEDDFEAALKMVGGEVTTETETAPESHYEVSADGKTINAKGDEITIVGIDSVGKGKLTLKLSDGSTIDSSEVSYSSAGEAMIYAAVANMDATIDADTAFKLVKAYDPASGISAEVYAKGLNQAYTYGFYGYERSDMTAEKALSAVLTEEQRNYAYEAGREYAEKHNEGNDAGIRAAHVTAKSILRNQEKNGQTVDKSGEVIFEDGLTKEQITKSKNGKQKNVSYLVAQKVSAKMGNDIHLYKGAKEFGFRAKSGDIWLNVNATADAQSMMLFTLSHELVHNARVYDPKGFKAFADFLVEQYGKHGKSVHDMVLAKQADYASQGKKLSYDKAYEEVVCDACERMLLDSNALEKLQLLEQKHPGIIERIIESIRNFLKHIREVFADVDPYADEAKFVKEMESEAQAVLNRLFENMMVDSGKHYSTIKAAFGKGTVVETNADGEFTIAKSDDGSEMLYNLSTWEKGGKETLQAALEAEGFSDEDIKAAMTIMDAKYDLVKKLGNEFNEQDRINQATITTDIKDGHSVLSALVSNGDYPVNIDLLMVCKKRKAYQRVINKLCETGMIQQATVDALAIAEINKILGKYGFETACLGCFVESRRLRIQEWANTIVKEWNSEVKKRNPNAKAFGFGKGEAKLTQDEVMQLIGELESGGDKNEQGNLNLGKGSAVKRMGVLLDKVPSLRKTLSVEDLITPDGLTALRKFDSNLFSMVKSRYGSNSPKFVQEFNPYNHELAKYGKVPSEYKSLREYLYAIGGARMQSFSDFIVENWFDYCQIVADLAARKLPMHTYTKEISLAKLFGLTGIKINMSLIPDIDRSLGKEFAGLTRNANGELELIWADKDRFKATGGKSYMQSINFADAIALQNDPRYSANVGTIAVGVSDKHILMMLDDNRIRMIIPYHSSGMNPIFADLMGTSFYKDYTMFQNTTVKQLYNSKGEPVSLKLEKEQSNKLTSGFQFNAVLQELGDARAAAQAYKDWCADASKHTITIKGETYTAELTPKFDSFSWHDNYYKLLEDFNTYDCISEEAAQQGDVQQIYPEDFEGILRAELTAQDKYRQKQEENQSFDKAMGEIESYLSTHSKADTVYYAEKNSIKLSDKDKKLNADEKRKLKALRDADLKMPKGMTSPTYEELIAKDPISVIDIGRNYNGLSYAELKDIVMKDVREMKIFDFPHPNKDTNVLVFLTEKSFYHTFSNLTSTFGEDTILAMDHISEIIYEAVLTHIAPPKNTDKAETRVFTFFAAVKGQNGIEPVKLTIKEYAKREAEEFPANIRKYFEENGEQEIHNRLYDAEVLEVISIESVKKESGASASDQNRTTRFVTKGTPNSTIKIADLLGLVNGGARKYIPVSLADQEYMAAVNRGDMETVQRMVNAFSRNAGYDARMFHETDADNIHIFDISRGDHGGTDSHTPYGIFTKSSAKNIGLGSKQMELFVKAHNTLRVENREDVVNKIPGFAKYYDQIQEIDKKYDAISNRLEDEELDALQEWIEEHPDVDMDEVFPLSYIAEGKPADIDYPKYLEAHERYVQNRAEWIETYNAVAVKAKAYITDYLRSNGYDSMYFVIDGGSRGRQTDSLIVLDENQVKSADPVTYDDNGDVIPLSQRFNQMNPDIRYKLPNTLRDAQAEATRKALEKQNEKLREDVSYLKELLKLQRSITGGKKITRSSVETVARTLKKELGATGNSLELAGYLNQLYSFIAESDELTWEGIAEKAQNAVAWLREHGNVEKDSFKELSDQELLRKVYDGYWGVSTLHTVADVKQKEINKLKTEHRKRMQAMKESHEKSIANLKQQQKQQIEDLREFYHKSTDRKLDAAKDRYQESRKKAVENREKTAVRHKIRKVIRDLDKILNRGNKKQNVKEDMKDFVAEALKSAEVLFTDNYTNEDIIRNGFGVELSKEEAKYLEEARKYMDELANLPVGGYDAWEARQEAEEKLKSKLAYRMSKLKDAFFRERQKLNKAEVADVLGNLADAYAKLETSEYAYVNGAYHEAVYQYLKMLQEDMGGAKVKDMTLGQLDALHKAYTMVLTTVQNANKMFADDLKQSKEELAKRVMMEVYQAGGEHGLWSKGQLARNQASWNNTKPIYAAERTGSSTFVQLVKGLFKGQYNWAVDMEEAKAFRQKIADKYGFKNWDMEKTYKFTSSTGIEFELNLNHIMALYAYAKREQAHDHLMKGGFVFGKNTEVVVTKNGIKRTYLNKSAKAHSISDEIMGEIVSKLSAEQKGFVDEMQEYLSTTMGGKGNEVSMRLYGVKLFMEKFYFPLRSAGQFKEKAKEAEMKQQQGQISIANSGFTNAVTPKASNPVVLDGFTDVWSSHVNEMSLYHSMVLPMEDFRRVYNYASPNMEGQESESVNSYIENAYGDAATGYFDQLYKELNGGAIVDPREDLSKQMIGKFKKAAVMLSNSVVVQQFSAIGRTTALINPKYFIGAKVDKQRHAALWDEVKKYAPVAIIKEIGGFDTHTGLSAKDYLMAEEYGNGERIKGLIKDKQYRDEIMGMLPAKADELTWCAIWEAVKRETKDKNPKMDVKSEEFLKKAGERFSEVIEKTQVYDSVLARSANMRSKNGLMQMLTAFMAEPTTTINMIEDALRKGNKKYIARTFGAVAATIIINNALASLIYGMRDDDEDETFIEKYFQAFTSGMLDDINPMTYYPILKDIWSLFQGYDIERSDMAIYSDIADSVKKVVTLISQYDGDMDKAEYYSEVGSALMGLLDAGASAFGIPWKNVRRDLVSYYNTFNTLKKDWFGGRDTTWNSFVDAVGGSALDSTPVVGLVAGESNTDKLYDAIVSGDTTYANRLKSGYRDQNAINNAIRKGLRENDPRIKEAAIAGYNGNPSEKVRIAKLIEADGFDHNDVVAAINAEISDMKPDEPTGDPKEKGYYTAADFAMEIANGDTASANAARSDIIATAEKNGKSRKEAEEAFASSARSELRDLFVEGKLSESKASEALKAYCPTKTGPLDDNDVYWIIREWNYEKTTGADDYGKYKTFYSAVQTGKDLRAVIKEYTDHGVEAKTLASQITEYFKPLYKEMSNYERASIKGYLLNAYALLGYDRTKKSKDIDKWLQD